MSTLQQLEELMVSGKIDRREFMARVSAMGLAAAFGPMLLSTGSEAAVRPKRGGRLRIGAGGSSTTDSLDPALLTDLMAPLVAIGQLRNCLVEITPEGNLAGELAESWEASPDATTWSFKLRRGIEFHHGKTLDAEDVVYSINHHRQKDSKSVVASIVKAIKEVRADGKYVVVFTLEQGNADFPFVVADYHTQIVPNGTTDFSKGIGTGGYILKKWEPGVRAFTVRNPNYWKGGRAHFDEVETLAINDVTARTNALRSGQVDVINRCERKTLHLLAKTPGIQAVNVTGYKHATIPMRTDTAPFDDNNIRMALKHAIDRNAVLKTVFRGYGELGNDHPISPLNRYYARELPQRHYDPDKAKFYLNKAGLAKLAVKLFAAEVAFEGALDTALLFREQAAKAGIDIEVVRSPNDGYWSDVWMKKPFCTSYWSGRPSEDWMFTVAYAAGAPWNETYWNNEKFMKLLVEARAELNEARRRQLYVEMQRICRDEGGAIIPVFMKHLHAASTKLQTPPKVAGDREMDGYRLPERWWFK